MSKRAICIDEKYAKRFLAVLAGRAYAGQDFIIMRDGVPQARLVTARS